MKKIASGPLAGRQSGPPSGKLGTPCAKLALAESSRQEPPMTLAEQLFKSVSTLPPAGVKEVIDFAQFLAQRQASQEDEDLMLAQQTATAEWDNPDDEAWSHAPAV